MDMNYGPEAAALKSGVAANHIRRIAAELAEAAFEKEIVLDVEWTDWAGRKQDKMIGRPVAMHAMRGISAHSNGFHTCRAIHLLQMLLGTIDVPGGFRCWSMPTAHRSVSTRHFPGKRRSAPMA
jgi:anaerobic selenocysteine-containing dehydrogenase